MPKPPYRIATGDLRTGDLVELVNGTIGWITSFSHRSQWPILVHDDEPCIRTEVNPGVIVRHLESARPPHA